jgi:hypothetical protein
MAGAGGPRNLKRSLLFLAETCEISNYMKAGTFTMARKVNLGSASMETKRRPAKVLP